MLSVIVVDYKSLDRTIKYVEMLTNQIKLQQDVHYIVVDNYCENGDLCVASDCDIKAMGIEYKCDKKIYRYEINGNDLVYIYSGGNMGYANGNNLGIKVSNELFGDDYYLVSNNDIEIHDPIDFKIIKDIFDGNGSIAVIGPKVIGLDGIPQSPNMKPTAFGNLFLTYLSMATHDRLFKWNDVDYTGESKICYRVMGSFMFLKASAVTEVGMFDENTFMYAEEMILSERLKRHGYQVYFCNDIEVIHAHGDSVNKVEDRSEPVKWSHESISYYFGKYRGTSEVVLFLGRLTCNLYLFIYRLKNKMISHKYNE